MVCGRFFKEKIVLLLVIFLSGCATTKVPNVGSGAFVIQEDEKRLMKRAEEAQELIDHSDIVYDDKSLEEYLNKIVARLLNRQELPDDIHISVKVIKDPALNAFSFSNGRIYVHLGILAVAENESQVATLLAHETTHVLHRHSLKEFRSIMNTTAWWEGIGILTGGVGAIVSELAKVSTISGYSKEMETEADETGFRMLQSAGYNIAESAKFFELLKLYNTDEDEKEPYFFSSHPHLSERIKNFSRLIADQEKKSPAADIADYSTMRIQFLLSNIQLCLNIGMYKSAERQIQHLTSTYADRAQGWLLKGDLYRQRQDKAKGEKERNKDKDYPLAIEAYERALAVDAGLSKALWGKARVLYTLGKKEEAKGYFQQYLTQVPDASDKSYILRLIQ